MKFANARLKIPAALLFAAASVSSVFAAPAQSPTAIVEDLEGKADGIQLMDYVTPGQVIKLGPKDSLVLSYLTSCKHETIVGGTVTIGIDHSEVSGGTVQRTTSQCGGGTMALTTQLADKSAAMAFRQVPEDAAKKPVQPQLTLYGRSPVIELKPIGALVIERVDVPGERHDFVLADAHIMHGKFLDLAASGVTLAQGGIYRARIGTQQIVFKVDKEAETGWTPIAGRLLRLQTN
jgi:hypothetical protein